MEYQLCNAQNGVQFRAIPLTSIKLFTGDLDYYNDISDIIQAHGILRGSLPNFLDARLPVTIRFNIQAWKHHLARYFDLVDLIQFGFPFDFDRTCVLGRTKKNHTSAIKLPQHVDNSIQEELSFQALAGRFDDQHLTLHIFLS